LCLDSLRGRDAALPPLKHLLNERAEGNPFFLEESVRTLVERQVLTGEYGAYQLSRDVNTIEIAPTVQALLAARIDHLAGEDKRLLECAAVIGKDVPHDVLQAVADLPADDLERGVAQLQAADFLYATQLYPDLEHTFKHALTHEVAYTSMLRSRRRALHARIVDAMETLHHDRLVEHVDRLAHHAFHGERWEKAIDYFN